MDRFRLWKRWLLIAGTVMVGFGAALAFLSGMPFFEAFNEQFNAPFWGAEALTGAELSYQRWVNGVLGATMIGWGIFFLFIVKYPLEKKEPWAWSCILFGIVTWFIIDTGISVYFGVYANALLNTALLLLVLVPLAFTKRYLRS